MALKFRRGSTADKSGSLAFGEPYVNTTLGTLQVGGNSGDLTLATVGDASAANFLSVSASTFVSASTLHITSNAEIKGNLTLGGNITIGDQTSDTVAVNANLSSSLIPSITNTFDLGSVTKIWKDIYVSTGSIKFIDPGSGTIVSTLSSNASGDFKITGEISGSSINGLGNAQQFSSSIHTRFNTLNSYTSSNNDVISAINATTSSLNTYTSSNNDSQQTQNNRLASLESESGSVRNTYNSYTSSANGRLSSLETASGSIRSDFNSLSSSIEAAVQFTGSNLTIKGDFLVKGTTTTINSTTVDIGDNIIQLNGSAASNGGIQVLDSTGGETGSLVWDNTNNYWKGGIINAEDRIILSTEFNTFTSSNQTIHDNHSGRLDDLESFSESINTYTSSQQSAQNTQNLRLNAIETSTGSLNSFTSSASGRLNSLETASGSLNTYTSSQDSRNSALFTATSSLNSYTSSQDSRNSALFTATSSLNSFTASIDTTIKTKLNAETVISGSSQVTISDTTGYTSFSSSVATTNAGQDTKIGLLETASGSLNTFTSSINTTIKNKLDAEGVISGSSQVLNGTTIHSGSFFNGISVVSGSSQIDHDLTTNFVSNEHIDHSSVSITAGAGLTGGGDITTTRTLDIGAGDGITVNANDVAVNSTVARTNSANTFNGNQTITGSLFITQDLIVQGSSSIQTISSSTLNIGTNLITVNALNPGTRFGGLSVIDSGSSPQVSGSLLFDSINDQWVFVHQAVLGSSITSSVLLMGPQSFDSLGSEIYPTTNKVIKSINSEHIGDSNITDTGTLITLGSNTSVTGTLVATGTSLVSGSSQISHDSTTGYVANRHIDHTAVSITAGNGLSGGGDISSTRTISLDTTSVTFTNGVKTKMNTDNVISSSAQITSLPSVDTDDLTEGSTKLYYTDARVKTKLSAEGVISGSSQVFSGVSGDILIASNGTATIQANSVALGTDTTGDYVASLVAGTNITLSNNTGEGATPTIGLTNNAITIAGSSTSLGGSISAATILSGTGVVSGSSQIDVSSTTGDIALGTRTSGNYVATITAGSGLSSTGATTGEGISHTLSIPNSGVSNAMLANSTISGISLGSNLATLTIGTGLSGTSYNGSTGVTIANTGVTSNVAGTGVSVSGATGAVTISIGQSVATSASPSFDKVLSTNNGNGENFKVGDDAWIGDVNTANCIRVKGQQDATAGYISFGNNATALGSTNSSTLTWGAAFTATGDITAYSDARVKENIKTIENGLDKVLALRGVTYNRTDLEDKTEKIGVIAQEIQEVLPQVVSEENDRLSVAYGNLAGIFIEAIKEQQVQIHQLTLEIENLKKQKGL